MFLVLMKGHPGTGKSTLARLLAKSLKCPLVDKDDIRNATFFIESFEDPIPDSNTGTDRKVSGPQVESNTNRMVNKVDSASLNTLSYKVMWNIAKSQLELGLSVVVDCPLARYEHFERGRSLGKACKAKVVVVECKPSNEDEWRHRLEERAAAKDLSQVSAFVNSIPKECNDEIMVSGSNSVREIDVRNRGTNPDLSFRKPESVGDHAWHKPSSWAEIEKLLRGYDGCWNYALGDTPHVIVDTTIMSRAAAVNYVLNRLRNYGES